MKAFAYQSALSRLDVTEPYVTEGRQAEQLFTNTDVVVSQRYYYIHGGTDVVVSQRYYYIHGGTYVTTFSSTGTLHVKSRLS